MPLSQNALGIEQAKKIVKKIEKQKTTQPCFLVYYTWWPHEPKGFWFLFLWSGL